MNKKRYLLTVYGTVQGVGFRPFVYRLARDFDLTGRVGNSAAGVYIEVEGEEQRLESFLKQLQNGIPPAAEIVSLKKEVKKPAGYKNFKITTSSNAGQVQVRILPDLATCKDCMNEVLDSTDRRYLYPFTNCTNCGPRYSIIRGLPYDRPLTSMSEFKMCVSCRQEYEDVLDRRFHAQPNACPDCGPRLCWLENGEQINGSTALKKAQQKLEQGKLLAVKGLGGFHLITSAVDAEAVLELRRVKQRPAKPLALMYPDLDLLKRDCQVTPTAEETLASTASPIVLLKRNPRSKLVDEVAPDTDKVGVMLPYTPLHTLLLDSLSFPVVATSANISGEPIHTDIDSLKQSLGPHLDGILSHERSIERAVDDSVVSLLERKPQLQRIGRGYAPATFDFEPAAGSVLALGGQLKNTIALSRRGEIITSQHLGDLAGTETVENYRHSIQDICELYEINPDLLVADLHPDYYSTSYGLRRPQPLYQVQHHHAHAASLLVDRQVDEEILALVWDGTGYGDDGTVWGGEFLLADLKDYRRTAHFRIFPLPGGEKAVEEPRRCALGLLQELNLEPSDVREIKNAFDDDKLKLLKQSLQRGVNTVKTSSAGRLFDGVAALLGLAKKNEFTGQAPMRLEQAARKVKTDSVLSYKIIETQSRDEKCLVFDWEPMVKEIIMARGQSENINELAAAFHNTLAAASLEIVERLAVDRVGLTGGCFQNSYLTERIVDLLRNKNIQPLIHRRLPPNDGGLAVGQAAIAEKRRSESSTAIPRSFSP